MRLPSYFTFDFGSSFVHITPGHRVQEVYLAKNKQWTADGQRSSLNPGTSRI